MTAEAIQRARDVAARLVQVRQGGDVHMPHQSATFQFSAHICVIAPINLLGARGTFCSQATAMQGTRVNQSDRARAVAGCVCAYVLN